MRFVSEVFTDVLEARAARVPMTVRDWTREPGKLRFAYYIG